MRLESDPLGFGLGAHDRVQSFDHIDDARRLDVDLHPPRFDLGHLQQLVDHLQEGPAAGEYVLDVPRPLRIRGRVYAGHFFQDLCESDDGVERRPQFVADVGQELALEAIGLEEPDVRLRELGDLEVETLVHGAEPGLALLDLGEHGVEPSGQLLELVTGLDLGANGEVPRLYLLGRLAERPHRLENQLGQDQIEDEDREQPGHDARRDDVDAVAEKLPLGVLAGVIDHQDGPDRIRLPRVGGARHRLAADAPNLRLPQHPGVPVNDQTPHGYRVGVLGQLVIGTEAFQGCRQERLGLVLVAGFGPDERYPQRGSGGRIVEEFIERLGQLAERLRDAEPGTVGQPRLGELASRFELTLAHEKARPGPRHAQGRGQNHQDREPEEKLALVGKADSGDHRQDPGRFQSKLRSLSRDPAASSMQRLQITPSAWSGLRHPGSVPRPRASRSPSSSRHIGHL